jgi:hypothetical protein
VLRPPAACRVVFDGQSRVNQPDWYGESIGAFFIGWCWPRLAMAPFGLPGHVQPAVGGTSLTTLASTFTTRAAPWIAPASFEPTIYVLCGGFTDYAGEHDTGAQVYADCGTLAGLARAAGAVYVICTTTLPSTAIAGADETQRQLGNALILADGSGHFDASIDFEVSGLDDPTDGNSYLDGVHIYGSLHAPTHGTGRAGTIAQPFIEAAIAAVT